MAWILILSLVISLLAGCAGDGSGESSASSGSETAVSSASSAAEEKADSPAAEEKPAAAETESESSSPAAEEPAASADAADSSFLSMEETEYYGEETEFTIEYDGELTPSAAPEEAAEGQIFEELPVTAQAAAEEITFEPLSEEELNAVAEEVRKEIEEAAEAGTDFFESEDLEGQGTPMTGGGSSDGPAFDPGQTQTAAGSAPKQLTIEDIQAMNPNTVVIDIYTNQGYLSTLVGKFYEGKVTNIEEGVLSIQPLAALLGLTKGCDFFAVYSERNNAGYTFYTYQQRYAGYTLRYATLRIIVDPDGYTAGLSCSFIPNVGTATDKSPISAKEAENVVKKRFASQDLTYYSDHTVRLAVPYNDQVYNCWVVYTDNPDADPSFDMPYLEHCVTTKGQYVTTIPANSFASKTGEAQDNSGYFKNMQVQDYSATYRLQDGTIREINVPVSYNSKDGKYYLMDPSRKIAVAQYYDFNYKDTVNFVTSDTIDGWSENNILAYASYISVYDFYLDHGLRSIDGFGVPILVTVGWCDENRNPVNNACFYGVNNGWACFGVSDVNYWYGCIDVVGHEYTHGITNQSMQGVAYRNETGAINESYSDIMGNLIEMSGNFTGDRTWKNAECSGTVNRDLGRPNDHEQPAYIGDRYYVPAVLNPDYSINDYGGVHINNSLLGHIAYQMDQAGMSYEQQISMWLTSIELITPLSDYQDLHGALLFSLKINGLLGSYGAALNRAFADAGLNENWTESYLTATRDGCGRVTFSTSEEIADSTSLVFFATEQGKIVARGFPDANGIVSALLPKGTYISQIVTANGNNYTYLNYTAEGWVEYGDFASFKVTDGGNLELIGTSGKAPGGQGTSTVNEKLNLVQYNGGYFSMLIPEGWKVEVNDQYTSFGVKISDPNDPSTQMFFYGGLAPYHKSEAARRFWALYDSSGVIANGPVLTQANILGILDTWAYCIEFQKYVQWQLFTDLYDIGVYGGGYYNGPCAVYNGIESACYAKCATKWNPDCRLTIAGGLVDYDQAKVYGGYYFYVCRGLSGVLAPADRYDAVFDDLITCFKSLTFSQGYILASQTVDPMADQATITRNLNIVGNVLTEVYHTFK